MHLYNTTSDKNKMEVIGLKDKPFGPGFTKEQINAADTIEVWCSDFIEPEEYTLFRLIKNSDIIHSEVIYGY